MDFLTGRSAPIDSSSYRVPMGICAFLHFVVMLFAIIGSTGVMLESSDGSSFRSGGGVYSGAQWIGIYATDKMFVEKEDSNTVYLSVPCDYEEGLLNAALALGVLSFLAQLFVFFVTVLRVAPWACMNIHKCDQNPCCFPPHRDPLLLCAYIMSFVFDAICLIFLLVSWAIPVRLLGDVPTCSGMQFSKSNAVGGSSSSSSGSGAEYTFANMGFHLGYGAVLLVIAWIFLIVACVIKVTTLCYLLPNSSLNSREGGPRSDQYSNFFQIDGDYGFSHANTMEYASSSSYVYFPTHSNSNIITTDKTDPSRNLRHQLFVSPRHHQPSSLSFSSEKGPLDLFTGDELIDQPNQAPFQHKSQEIHSAAGTSAPPRPQYDLYPSSSTSSAAVATEAAMVVPPPTHREILYSPPPRRVLGAPASPPPNRHPWGERGKVGIEGETTSLDRAARAKSPPPHPLNT